MQRICHCYAPTCDRTHLRIIPRVATLELAVYGVTNDDHEHGLVGRLRDMYTYLGYDYDVEEFLRVQLMFLEQQVFSE